MTEPTPTTLTARNPEDLLAMVPIVIGFAPTDSVVMLTFAARHSFHARVDLPVRADDVDDLVDALLGPARRNRVTRVAFVFYSDHRGPVRRAWRGLRRGCEAAGIDVVEALRSDGRRWYPLLGGDQRVRELGVGYDISAHPFAAQAVVDGRVTHASRGALATLLHSDPRRLTSVTAALAAMPADRAGDGPDWVGRLVDGCVAEGSSPSDGDAARLLRAFEHPAATDAACAALDRGNAQAHVDLWVDLLRRTPSSYLPPVASLLALAAWQAGNGALAWCAVDRCAEVDPDHPLMTYVASVLTHAVPPGAWEADRSA